MNALNIYYLAGDINNLKKKEIVAKRRSIRAFGLYMQIKNDQIFTRSRA